MFSLLVFQIKTKLSMEFTNIGVGGVLTKGQVSCNIEAWGG